MKRISPRSTIDVAVTLSRGGRTSRAMMRDISPDGASVSAQFPPGSDETISIARNGMSLAARVVWARGKAFGIVFKPALDPEQIYAITG
ncbi:MAG: PilZ domain-containing protein [Sphingomonadaceae bacterium]|nr:PilZ domain-containing protein [Sphingomonadaceae bacterium]